MIIEVKDRNSIRKIEAKEGQTILEALQGADVYMSALCAGRGTCQKCRVKILEGKFNALEEGRNKISDEDWQRGVRLACKTYARSDLLVELESEADSGFIVQAVEQTACKEAKNIVDGEVFIAADIGTTTIAMALVNQTTGEILDTYAALNRQRMYGADVISRISAANNGDLSRLQKLIEEDLWQGVLKLTGISSSQGVLKLTEGSSSQADENSQGHDRIHIGKIVLAANTTMVHLLMGYSCESLGRHPFHSDHLGIIKTSFRDIDLIILPGISAFVGGDITSDLLICPEFEGEEVCLLLDLGTNGEMVIGNRDRLLAAGTAAGPAFEGGNITCGTGSIAGAINQVKIQNRRAFVGTIGGKQPPVGICGTGIISALARLKQNRIMDKSGALLPPYDASGYPLWMGTGDNRIAVFQQDIRQLQLAKGAIRAGMEQLMEAFGCRAEEVKKLYLAGGFGTKLPTEDAIEIGLLPKAFEGKIESIGNGALRGAVYYGALSAKRRRQLENILNRAELLPLALSEGFEEKYIKYLEF